MVSTIYDIAFKPDGTELIAAADNKVLVYDGSDGTLLKSLKGHKDCVYAVTYSFTGELFASGSADKAVIIWNDSHEGTLKYSHNESVQCLAFNPFSNTLLSCSVNDFGLWQDTNKNVSKYKVYSRCCTCAWNSTGEIFAIGMFDGSVSIRSETDGELLHSIIRPGGEPVWALTFASPRIDYTTQSSKGKINYGPIHYPGEMLVVTDWAKTISFYNLEGQIVPPNEKNIDFDVFSIAYMNNGNFLIAGGINKNILLYTREGTCLGCVAIMDSWVTVIKVKPKSNTIVVGCVDGGIACYQLMFSTVHGLHKDKYAYRLNMTDVIIQHLNKQINTRINCGDLVKKVAVYNNKLAIQLSDKINIYNQVSGDKDNEPLDYRLVERINQNFECSLLVICSEHLILCQEKRLQCYDFKGIRQREWIMDSLIRYIKVIGGPSGREAILLGLRNGFICKIFVDNPFPVIVYQLKNAVRCLDISQEKKKLAIVDENGVCTTVSLLTKEILFSEPNSSSVAYNTDNENLLCYSGNNILNVKALNFTPNTQKMQGFVVGFSGKKVFSLHLYQMSTIEVPLTNHMYQYLEKHMYKEAYDIAILGVTENDWNILGNDALENFDFEIAKKSFSKIKDCRSLMLLYEAEDMFNKGLSKPQILGYILSHQGRFRDAATLYQQNDLEINALDMFSELRMFDEAQEYMLKTSVGTQKAILRKKAEWAELSNNMAIAAKMLVDSEDYEKAIQIMIDNDWLDMVIQTLRKINKGNTELLRTIGYYLIKKEEFNVASTIFTSINDVRSLLNMHIAARQWDDVFAICNNNPQYMDIVYLPYARWLAEEGRFDEAQEAYKKSGNISEAFSVLNCLVKNSINEKRYMDSSYYYWKLATTYLLKSQTSLKYIDKFYESLKYSEIYYAYNIVYKCSIEPFTSIRKDNLFNILRYLILNINDTPNISRIQILLAFTELCKEFKAYKTARLALDQLTQLNYPIYFESQIHYSLIDIRVTPFTDNEDLLPLCFKCGLHNPLLGKKNCTQCNTEFLYSFYSFEILPLVEVKIDSNITDEEAIELISKETGDGDINTSSIIHSHDPTKNIILSRDQLLQLDNTNCFIQKWPKPLKYRYYLNVLQDINISYCDECFKFFLLDDYEEAIFENDCCPFCRKKIIYPQDADKII
ncbi:Intraflagellar transport protein 122 homolog [Strongyloides ratti]|uniref:Intraflagellar transport protein 122 homolog n=1 Tax=Strongyloides ratti TaxID=34506 RepID=A0A090LN85_STRRB|nr:Intraflagellar transport protein 122 homolog [Strongyloides ratti]CEF71315.1 Intraflagellar transport protein 122 homolog [Strongyloides ratti]